MRRTSLTLAALVAVLSTAASSQQAPAVKEEAPGLLAKATVTPAQALPIAMAKVPTGVLHSAEIEQEDGKLVYSFDIKAPGKPGVEEVVVDAMTGKVVGVEHESDEVEAKEQRTEKKASP
jgi:uncharacterized membrane protein YkoI